MKQGNWHRPPQGFAPYPYAVYGCPPGQPEVPGCRGQVCLNKRCDRVNCASGAVLAPAEDGWFGICVPRPCVEPTPAPTPTPGPVVTPPPSAGDPRVLIRMGAATHGCRALKEGQTKVTVNTTPRVPRFEGDTKGDEQPREHNDPRGPVCTQSMAGGWQNEEMEQATGSAYLCQSALPPGIYTFRACPRDGVPLADPNFPGICGETVVEIVSHGVVNCLSGCATYFKNGPCK